MFRKLIALTKLNHHGKSSSFFSQPRAPGRSEAPNWTAARRRAAHRPRSSARGRRDRHPAAQPCVAGRPAAYPPGASALPASAETTAASLLEALGGLALSRCVVCGGRRPRARPGQARRGARTKQV